VSQDPIVELYEKVTQIPSIFGRLVYIANLWNAQTGRYDRGLPVRFANADQSIAKWHQAFFVEWLALSMPEKERDVVLYWRTIGGRRDQIKSVRQHGEAAMPPLVRSEERMLFVRDLSFVVALL
jgi:hypothetical protein